jgi:hypothetical protein
VAKERERGGTKVKGKARERAKGMGKEKEGRAAGVARATCGLMTARAKDEARAKEVTIIVQGVILMKPSQRVEHTTLMQLSQRVVALSVRRQGGGVIQLFRTRVQNGDCWRQEARLSKEQRSLSISHKKEEQKESRGCRKYQQPPILGFPTLSVCGALNSGHTIRSL